MQIEAQSTERLKNQLKITLKANKKILVLSHSQGSFFTNNGARELEIENPILEGADSQEKAYTNYLGLIRNLQVATPASSIVLGGSYITNKRDFINLVPGSLPGNEELELVPNEVDNRSISERIIMNHSFIDTYTTPILTLREKVTIALLNEAERLESNCGTPPVARFTADSREKAQETPDSMTYDFDAQESYDQDELPNPLKPYLINYKFDWTIDNTYFLSGLKPSFTFMEEGRHKVQLIVTDPDGNKSIPYFEEIDVRKIEQGCNGRDGKYPYLSNATAGFDIQSSV